MNHDSSLIKSNDSGSSLSIPHSNADDSLALAQEPRPLARLHGLLRGRYILTFCLAAILGCSLAFAGYSLWRPKYESVALIRVAPNLPRILFHSEQNDALPMYEGYVGSQMAMMSSERVVDRAMQKPQWRQWNRGLSEHAVQEFRESMEIERERGAEMINIRFTDTDPATAQAGAKAIVDGYMEIFGEEDIKRHKMQLSVLESRRIALAADVKAMRDQIFDIAKIYGTDTLENLFASRMEVAEKLGSSLKNTEIESTEQLLIVKQTPSFDPDKPPAAHSIGMEDRVMERLISDKESIELEIIDLLYYRTEIHPTVIRARSRLTTVKDRIAAYQQEFNQSVTRREQADPLDAAINKHEILQARANQYRTSYDDASEKALELGRQNLQISQVRQEVTDTEKRLEETMARIEQLNVESSVSGRISVISSGDRPGPPVNARQRIQLTALGAMLGIGCAIGFMTLVGAGNRRIRFVDQATSGPMRATVIGVVPEISSKRPQEDAQKFAALSVHQIRARLQLDGLGKTRKVLAVTSATPGEGKTSLACALGLSLAASGKKTLLIDFDLNGQGLTSIAMERARLGDMLVREGELSPKQLNNAIVKAARNGWRIGDMLVEAGYVSREKVEDTARKQWAVNGGLADVLAGQPIEHCLINHTPELLSILPVGNTDGHDLTTLSPERIESFLQTLKQEYDVILLDCGPVPASLDASLVIPHADAVLFVMSQGARQAAVQRAFDHLDDLRTEMAGVVFNRGQWQEVQSYGSSSSSTDSRARMNSIIGEDAATADYAKAYGPLAHATAAHQRRHQQSQPAVVWND